MEVLPIELYELIASYLPRSSILNMRLVNKEFDKSVSGYLFKTVVVPFKPEIYGILPEPRLAGIADAQNRANEMLQGSVMVQDKGMRVFQGFGRHIRKFAMSFELDENKLAHPPIKCDQEAIRAFWGIYRWPYKKYNRYAQLEGLEQTADETRTMAKALRFVSKAKELGLSIDGGLGWLSGPDINERVLERGGKIAVFGESNFVPEDKTKVTKEKPSDSGSSSPSVNYGGSQHAQFQRILEESGLSGPSLQAALEMMMEGEHITGLQTGNHLQANPYLRSTSNSTSNMLANIMATPPTLPALGPIVNPYTGGLNYPLGNNNQLAQPYTDDDIRFLDFIGDYKPRVRNGSCLLKPNELTNAQREMLLEIEWAQRAFMQSYAIAIIDNPSTFSNIEKLTIARIPSRHLPILRRADFWDGLPQLSKLSLAVIPDWRDVVKLPTSWVQDIKLAPSQAISVVFKLLEEQISRRQNIKTLHFEWICGGEGAPGLFARNQHILAAPLVLKAMDMVNRSYVAQLLPLPHIEHLSLKNCWASPHILARLGLTLKKQALQTLTLDSVSLTAALQPNAQPNPVTGHDANNHPHHAAANVLNFQLPGPPPPQPAAAPTVISNTPPVWLQPPRAGSWAALIDTLTPGETLAQIRYARQFDLNEPERHDPGTITRLEFKSCGYVRLPLDFDQSALGPPALPAPPAPQPSHTAMRIYDLDSYMMKPHDYTLGHIVSHISDVEMRTLENVWNMDVGWGTTRSALFVESREDGIEVPGRGRFDGVVCQPPHSSSIRS
jgi:hypothetical protein